mgnify:CR=1 FL=1
MHAAASGERRVVITGMGVICPLGNTLEDLWSGLTSQKSGVASLPDGLGHLPTRIGAVAGEFSGDISGFGELAPPLKKAIRKGLKLMCRESQMAVAAAQRALDDAGFADAGYPPERAGIVFGSDYMLSEPSELATGMGLCFDEAGAFHFSRWGESGMREMQPLWLLKYLPNMPACHVAIYNDLRGPNNSLTLREASSNAAIGEAGRTIARGSADLMVAGATGTRLHTMKRIHTALAEEIADGDDAEGAPRPFAKDRRGMVLGEGSGAIVLEEYESARQRGARIYGELVGSGSSVVARPRGPGCRDMALANAMRAALNDARLRLDQIGHIHAHGLGTQTADIDESRAIGEIFGDQVTQPPVTTAKSYFGNLGAGSGTVELVASLLALAHAQLFPVLNFHTADPECPVNVARGDNGAAGSSFLNSNVTQQGQAAVVAVRRLDD